VGTGGADGGATARRRVALGSARRRMARAVGFIGGSAFLCSRPSDTVFLQTPMLSWDSMSTRVCHVHADWDPDVEVWVATCEDVPGLATEASTIEILTKKLRDLIPELLEANQLLTGDSPQGISFELTSHRHEKLSLTP
jgi:predicted RNase H-like HicB family nuclease